MTAIHSVYSNFQAAFSAFKDIGRLRGIAKVLIHHGFGHLVQSWNLQDRAILNLLLEPAAEHEPSTLYTRIRRATEELGPTFVKLGQILSTRTDLLPKELCQELTTLQDHVAQIPWEEARDVLEKSLGQKCEEVFSDINTSPLASASMAQVHTAHLKSGEEVVFKIQRPGIDKTLDADLHLLDFMAKQLELNFPESKVFHPVEIVREFSRTIRKEVQFTIEAANLERFARNFASWQDVKIPHLYKEYTSDRVIVMERLVGTKITAVTGMDLDEIAHKVVAILFKMVFEDGFFHGDLHPGNILIMPDGSIGLIDFGMVGHLSKAAKDRLADLLLAIATKNEEAVVRALLELGHPNGPIDAAAFEEDVLDALETNISSKSSLVDLNLGGILQAIMDGAVHHNLTLPSNYTMLCKAMLTVEGIGKTIAPDLDLIKEIKPYIERLVAERYSPESVLKAAGDTLQGLGRLSRQLPTAGAQLLKQISNGHLTIALEQAHEKQLEHSSSKRLSSILRTVIACTALFCGTLARNDTGTTILGLPTLSFLFFTLALYLLISQAWRNRK